LKGTKGKGRMQIEVHVTEDLTVFNEDHISCHVKGSKFAIATSRGVIMVNVENNLVPTVTLETYDNKVKANIEWTHEGVQCV
jgi:hypothetical protein